jgi:hypothetical protein
MREAAPPDVPHGLIEVVDRCLFKLKAQRWQSAGELHEALSPFSHADHLPEIAAAESAVIQADTLVQDVSALARGTVEVEDQPRDPLPATSCSLPEAAPAPKHTILCLASDSTGTDGSRQLAQQTHAIRAELERARARDRFEVVTQFVSEPLDLLRVLRTFKPTVVYFVRNGRESTEYQPGQALVGDRFGGLFFRSRDGRARFLTASVLEQTFGAAGASVRLVVLNGCYADLQAEALLSHVDCVVGTRGTVSPEVAQAYAIGLMGALGERESIATAHKHAAAAMSLAASGDLPQSDAPQLKVRHGVDADKLVLAAPAAPRAPRG